MKKRLFILFAFVSAVLAVVLSYTYAQNHKTWALVLTACVIAALLFCIVGIVLSARAAGTVQPSAYRKKSNYISRAEFEFLQILRTVVGNRYVVCTQVPLVSVIDKPGASFRNELFRVIDFMIADPVSYEPLLLIELNDASHNRADRMERDRKVAQICSAAKMPLVSFTLAEAKNPIEVKRRIYGILR